MSSASGRLSINSMNILTEEFSPLEIREAMSQMHPTKAHSPDGFSAIFFQRFWCSIGPEFTRVTLKNVK